MTIEILIAQQRDAIQARDVDRLMSVYAPDVVYFDVVPPLQFVGAAALRRRFTEWFESFATPLEVDMRDLQVSESSEMAVAYWFSRVRGTMKNGRETGSWVRVTTVCRLVNGQWLVIHEHVSRPMEET